jgi:hypothetical protein
VLLIVEKVEVEKGKKAVNAEKEEHLVLDYTNSIEIQKWLWNII